MKRDQSHEFLGRYFIIIVLRLDKFFLYHTNKPVTSMSVQKKLKTGFTEWYKPTF